MFRLLLYKDISADDEVVEAIEVAREGWRNFWSERGSGGLGIGGRLFGTQKMMNEREI
jgi:hypothetical protein